VLAPCFVLCAPTGEGYSASPVNAETIAVVDDTEGTRLALRRTLERAGYDVIEGACGVGGGTSQEDEDCARAGVEQL